MAFQKLGLIPQLYEALKHKGYTTPTPIQQKAIPELLKGKDLMGIAQTGTGKTAAFLLPLLQTLSQNKKRPIPNEPRALILAPTRELVAQIGEGCKDYGKNLRISYTTVFGGVSQRPQTRDLNKGVDILVATPGRLLDLMDQGYIELDAIEVFILDEADRMLDMGFIKDIKKILPILPKKRQTLFFSATMSMEVTKLAKGMLKDPVRVEITPQSTPVERIDQAVYFVDKEKKDILLLELMKHLDKVLVFTKTKHRAERVAKGLTKGGFRAESIHGDKSQKQRTIALDNFKKGKVHVLVATDIAARGIDVKDISHVINYELPNEAESYVHRIGRTARAGSEGTAYSFCSADERNFLRSIEKLTGLKLTVQEHAHHSEKAQNAKGGSAKQGGYRGRGGSGGGRRGGGSRGGGSGDSRGSSGGRRRGGPPKGGLGKRRGQRSVGRGRR